MTLAVMGYHLQVMTRKLLRDSAKLSGGVEKGMEQRPAPVSESATLYS